TNQSVLATTTETSTENEMRSAEVTRVEATPSATSTTGTTTTAEEPKKIAPPPTTTAEQQPTSTYAPPAAAPSSERPGRRLPRTGSPLALYELLSGLAFAAAYGVRRLRKYN